MRGIPEIRLEGFECGGVGLDCVVQGERITCDDVFFEQEGGSQEVEQSGEGREGLRDRRLKLRSGGRGENDKADKVGDTR